MSHTYPRCTHAPASAFASIAKSLFAAAKAALATLFVAIFMLFTASRATAEIPIAMTQIGNPAFDVVDVNLFSPNFVPTMSFEVSLTLLPNHGLYFDESTGNPAPVPRLRTDRLTIRNIVTASLRPDTRPEASTIALTLTAASCWPSRKFRTPCRRSALRQTSRQAPLSRSTLTPTRSRKSCSSKSGPLFDFATTSFPYPSTPAGFGYENGDPITFAGLLESHLHYDIGIFATLDIPDEFIVGQYVRAVSFLDANGNGWEFSVPFQVVPEPSTLTLLACCLVVLFRRSGGHVRHVAGTSQPINFFVGE